MEPLVGELDRAAENRNEARRDGGAEVAKILAENDGRCRGRDGFDLDRVSAGGQLDTLEAAVAECAPRKGSDGAAGGIDVDGDRPPFAAHTDALRSETLRRVAGQLERVRRLPDGLVAPGFDPRDEPELVEKLANLLGRLLDHGDVACGRLTEIARARERQCESVHGRERRAQVVARKRDEASEMVGVGHGGRATVATIMSVPRAAPTHDLQASPPDVPLALSRAGVTGVSKAIRIRYGETERLIAAEIDCTVDLEPEQKGVHMSRFPELFEEAIDEVVIGEALLVEDLAAHIARQIVGRQRAGRAEVRIVARYPLERTTPVTGLPTQDMVSLIGVAAASQRQTRRVVGVEATGMNACPCAQGMIREVAAERLGDAGFDALDVERILELVPLATHNQRGRGTLYVGSDERVNAEQLVRIVEGSMSSPVYELLKRPDELFVVEHAHLQPRFVEDSVRLALRETLATYPTLRDGDFVLARQVNFETIHAHDVIAERYGAVGELRGELESGTRPARHTELRDWLGAA